MRIVVSRSVFGDGLSSSPLERGAIEGESPVEFGTHSYVIRFQRVG